MSIVNQNRELIMERMQQMQLQLDLSQVLTIISSI